MLVWSIDYNLCGMRRLTPSRLGTVQNPLADTCMTALSPPAASVAIELKILRGEAKILIGKRYE